MTCTVSEPLTARRSDRCGNAISCLDRVISSKGDYFLLSAFLHKSLSFCAATPWCSDSMLLLPNWYQPARCNMDKSNTCNSIGNPYCHRSVGGISLSFQLDALRLSATRCYVISQRRLIVSRTLIRTQSKVLWCLVESSSWVQSQSKPGLTLLWYPLTSYHVHFLSFLLQSIVYAWLYRVFLHGWSPCTGHFLHYRHGWYYLP